MQRVVNSFYAPDIQELVSLGERTHARNGQAGVLLGRECQQHRAHRPEFRGFEKIVEGAAPPNKATAA